MRSLIWIHSDFRIHPTSESDQPVLCHKSDILMTKENMDDYYVTSFVR